MSTHENKQVGCLGAILGLWLMVMTFYTPAYFLILNDEIDAVQEASLLDFMFNPLVIAFESSTYTKGELKELKRLIDNTRKDGKKRLNIDMGMPFEKALAKNKLITDIEFYEAGNNGVTSRIITEFVMKDIGRVKLVSHARSRNFWKVQFTQFIMLESLYLNGQPVTTPQGFIAQYVYGIEDTEVLAEIDDILNQLT